MAIHKTRHHTSHVWSKYISNKMRQISYRTIMHLAKDWLWLVLIGVQKLFSVFDQIEGVPPLQWVKFTTQYSHTFHVSLHGKWQIGACLKTLILQLYLRALTVNQEQSFRLRKYIPFTRTGEFILFIFLQYVSYSYATRFFFNISASNVSILFTQFYI